MFPKKKWVKQPTTRKRMPKQKTRAQLKRSWKLKLLKVWSALVRLGGRCEKCGRSDIKRDAHHIFPRKTAIKPHWFYVPNGLDLCFNCHRDGAHSLDYDKQVEFHNWLVDYLPKRGQTYEGLKAICQAKGRIQLEDMEPLYNDMVAELKKKECSVQHKGPCA